MPPARQKNTLLADFQIHTLDWFYIDTGGGHVMRRDLVYCLIWLRVFLPRLIEFALGCRPRSFPPL